MNNKIEVGDVIVRTKKFYTNDSDAVCREIKDILLVTDVNPNVRVSYYSLKHKDTSHIYNNNNSSVRNERDFEHFISTGFWTIVKCNRNKTT